MAGITPGNVRTGSYLPGVMSFMDGVRQAGYVIRLDWGVTVFIRHPDVTWTRSGTTITCTWDAHGFANGDTILVRDPSDTAAITSNVRYVVGGVTLNTFTFTATNAGATAGWLCGYKTYDMSADATCRTGLGLYLQSGVYGIRIDDDHYALAIAVDSQDRIHLAGNGHTNIMRYVRSAPNDIETWTDVCSTGGGTYPFFIDLTGANSHTYHDFTRLEDGTLLWFADQPESATNSRGRDYIFAKLVPGSGTLWLPVLDTWEFAVTLPGMSNSGPSDYINADRVYVKGGSIVDDKMHVAITWRTGNIDGDSAVDTSYIWAYLDDLTEWFTVTGAPVTMPLTYPTTEAGRTAAGHFISVEQASTPTGGHGVAIDRFGYPHIVLEYGVAVAGSGPTGVGNDTSAGYHDHYWNGTAWVQEALAGVGGANGPSLHGLWDENGTWGGMWLVTEGPRAPDPRGLRVRNKDTGVTVYGGATGSGFEAQPDPIRLRRGILSMNVPDGDEPWVYEFGGHAAYDGAQWVTDNGTATADGSRTLDLGAGALTVLTLRLIVTAFTGFTDVTWTLEDSSDNVTWYSHTPFDPTTGTGEQVVRLAGYRRVIRLTWTVTGTGSMTFSIPVVKETSSSAA